MRSERSRFSRLKSSSLLTRVERLSLTFRKRVFFRGVGCSRLG